MFKCPQCGNTAEAMGNCPTCNVPMVEDKPMDTPAEGGEQPAEGGDAPAGE